MIRFYKEADYEYIFNLLREFNKDLDLKSNPFYKCIVYDDGIIKGCLLFEEIYNRMEIDYIIVAKEYRSCGIASRLIGFLINYSKSNSISNITLEVNEKNIPAINLYKKYGFKLVSIRKNYYIDNDAILMIRKFDKNE